MKIIDTDNRDLFTTVIKTDKGSIEIDPVAMFRSAIENAVQDEELGLRLIRVVDEMIVKVIENQ